MGASSAAAPGLIPLHRNSVSKAIVITRKDVVNRLESSTGNSGPNYSRGQPRTGMTKADAEAVVKGITDRWGNAPAVVVVQDMNDPNVPDAVRLEDAKQKSQGASGEPEGFWYGGKAYIVPGALKSPGSVMRVLFHETLVHYGLRSTFGDSLKPMLQQLAALRRPLVEAKAKQYGLDMSKEADRMRAAEEVLAEMAQNTTECGFVKQDNLQMYGPCVWCQWQSRVGEDDGQGNNRPQGAQPHLFRRGSGNRKPALGACAWEPGQNRNSPPGGLNSDCTTSKNEAHSKVAASPVGSSGHTCHALFSTQ